MCEVCKEGIKAPTIRHFKVIAHDATDGLTSFVHSFIWLNLHLFLSSIYWIEIIFEVFEFFRIFSQPRNEVSINFVQVNIIFFLQSEVPRIFFNKFQRCKIIVQSVRNWTRIGDWANFSKAECIQAKRIFNHSKITAFWFLYFVIIIKSWTIFTISLCQKRDYLAWISRAKNFRWRPNNSNCQFIAMDFYRNK